MDQFLATIFKGKIEELLTDLLYLVSNVLLDLSLASRCNILRLPAKFCLESLRVDVLLQVDYVEDLSLEQLETLSEILILVSHTSIHLFVLLVDHQVIVMVARDLAEFALRVGLDGRHKLSMTAQLISLVHLLVT